MVVVRLYDCSPASPLSRRTQRARRGRGGPLAARRRSPGRSGGVQQGRAAPAFFHYPSGGDLDQLGELFYDIYLSGENDHRSRAPGRHFQQRHADIGRPARHARRGRVDATGDWPRDSCGPSRARQAGLAVASCQPEFGDGGAAYEWACGALSAQQLPAFRVTGFPGPRKLARPDLGGAPCHPGTSSASPSGRCDGADGDAEHPVPCARRSQPDELPLARSVPGWPAAGEAGPLRSTGSTGGLHASLRGLTLPRRGRMVAAENQPFAHLIEVDP
jgi:hypothetical protein